MVLRDAEGKLSEKLVRVTEPALWPFRSRFELREVMIIPNLAIHLQTAEERKAHPLPPRVASSSCFKAWRDGYRLKVQEEGVREA